MRKYLYGLGAIVVPVLFGASLTAGCTDENGNPTVPGGDDVCGPCGSVVNGDVGISGDVRLDGFFKALGTINTATTGIKADFDANIRALAALYPEADIDVDGAINTSIVGEVTAAIEADISANVQGSLQVVYQPPRCEASINVAVEAQARCEAQADCDVDVNPGEVSVKCEGSCTGSCEGSCDGTVQCRVEAPSVACEGTCEGSCTFEAAAACEGTCRGDCNGACSVRDASGDCAGKCDGTCAGTCEFTAAAECNGTCSGKCTATAGSAECEGEVTCQGTCEGSCTGGCEGNFEPPSASASCTATADCQASAKAEANASLECTPPQLSLEYAFAGNLDANARAQFSARLNEVKLRGAAIVQGFTKYQALITGKVSAEANAPLVFDPPPFVALRASFTALATPSAFADFDISLGKVACVVPALQEAGTVAASLATETTGALQAQASFVTAFTGGFES
jgi:modification target Cys-rich repeat protein